MIIAMGMPGAGKSTVLGGIKNYRKVNYGDLMFEIARKRYGIKNRDGMRKMSTERQTAVQLEVGRKLSREKGRLLLDTHCSVRTQKGYLPGLPFSILKKMKVEGFVYISAPADDIMRRRKKDKSRRRDEEEREEIEEHDGVNRAFLAVYSAFTGAPSSIVLNGDGMLEDAVAKMKRVLGE
jgi:adenylate kinase